MQIKNIIVTKDDDDLYKLTYNITGETQQAMFIIQVKDKSNGAFIVSLEVVSDVKNMKKVKLQGLFDIATSEAKEYISREMSLKQITEPQFGLEDIVWKGLTTAMKSINSGKIKTEKEIHADALTPEMAKILNGEPLNEAYHTIRIIKDEIV